MPRTWVDRVFKLIDEVSLENSKNSFGRDRRFFIEDEDTKAKPSMRLTAKPLIGYLTLLNRWSRRS